MEGLGRSSRPATRHLKRILRVKAYLLLERQSDSPKPAIAGSLNCVLTVWTFDIFTLLSAWHYGSKLQHLERPTTRSASTAFDFHWRYLGSGYVVNNK